MNSSEKGRIRFGAYDKMLLKKGHAKLFVKWIKDGHSRKVIDILGVLNDRLRKPKHHHALGYNGHYEMHDYIYMILLYSENLSNYELAHELGAEYACGLAGNENWEDFKAKAKEFRDTSLGPRPPSFPKGGGSAITIHKNYQMRALCKKTFRSPTIEAIRILHELGYDLNCAIDYLWGVDCNFLPDSETITFLFDNEYLRIEDFNRLPLGRAMEICGQIGAEGEFGDLQILFDRGVTFEKEAMDTLIFEAGTRNNHDVLSFLYKTKRLDLSDIRFIISETIEEDRVHNLYDYSFEKEEYTLEHVQECVENKEWGCLLYILNENPCKENDGDSKAVSLEIGMALSNVEGQIQSLLETLKNKAAKKEFCSVKCLEKKKGEEEYCRIPERGHQSYENYFASDWCDFSTKLLCRKHLVEKITATEMFLKLCKTVPKNICVPKQTQIERYFQKV